MFYDLSALYSERRFQRPVRVLNAQWASEGSPALPGHCFQITFLAGPGMQSHLRPVGATSKQAEANRLQDQPAAQPQFPRQVLRPPAPRARTALRNPFPTAHPGRSLSPVPHSHPPEPHRRSQPTSKFLAAPAFPGKGRRRGEKKTMTSRAGLFGFVCLLVGSIKYSWKVNVPHTGEV